MSVISVDIIWQGEGGSRELGAVRKRVRKFQVICDGYTDPDLILRDTRLPRDGDSLPSDSSQYCESVEIEADDRSRIKWIVTATYNSSVDNQELEISKKGGTGLPPNPFDDPPEISYTTGQRQIPVWRGKPIYPADGSESIQNTAGDVFDPPAMMNHIEPVLRVVRNEASFSYDSHIKPYANRTNSVTFANASAGKVLCTAVDATVEWERDVRFYRVSYSFTFRPFNLSSTGPSGYDGEDLDKYPWAIHQPNVGFYSIRGTATVPNQNQVGSPIVYVKNRIKDNFGEDVQVPQYLNTDGSLRDPAANGKIRPIFLSWHVYGEADFNTLNLGV